VSALRQFAVPAEWTAPTVDRVRREVPRLRLVRAPQVTSSPVPFAALCGLVLVSALLGALVLNTSMARCSYEAHALQIKLAEQARIEQSLSSQLAEREAPEALADAARALGMVPAPELAFLRLSDGVILGNPVPAKVGR
jgi:hypothetical protein